MSRFYGEMNGQAAGTVTRAGGERSGVSAHVRGWGIGGKVEVFDRNGADVVLLQVTGGSNAPNTRETPWIEVEDFHNGEYKITVRPGPEGKVISW